jgi:hypothetical protein
VVALLRDEGDNHLIGLAVAGGATHVARRNLRDLRNAELRRGKAQRGLHLLQKARGAAKN